MISGDDSAELDKLIAEENRYSTGFEITREQAAAMGGADESVNIYAVGVSEGYAASIVNMKKIVFARIETEIPTELPTENASEVPSISPVPTTAPGGGSTGGSGGSGGGVDSDADIEDGRYRVEIALYNASTDQTSMGNSAFENNSSAILNVVGGTGTLTCATNPVSISPYYSALKDILFKNANGDWQKVTAVETKTIDANDGNGTHSLNYLSIFSLKLPDVNAEYISVKINVPYTPMDDIAEDGYIEARLKLYRDTITATDVNDKLTANTTAALGSVSSGGSNSDDSVSGELSSSAALNLVDNITGIKMTAANGVFSKKVRMIYNLSPIKSVYKKADEILGGSVKSYKL